MIVRGFGLLENERLSVYNNMLASYHDPTTAGECAVSIASLPGLTALEIVATDTNIVHKHYRWGYAGDLVAAFWPGFEDTPPPAHALAFATSLLTSAADPRIGVLLRSMPHLAINPFHADRKKKRGGPR